MTRVVAVVRPPRSTCAICPGQKHFSECSTVGSLTMRARSGARWGELIALCRVDLDFEPQRVVRIHRAVEQSARGMSIKTTKNRQQRVSTFPASLVADLRQRARDVERVAGPQGLLFPRNQQRLRQPPNLSAHLDPWGPEGRLADE